MTGDADAAGVVRCGAVGTEYHVDTIALMDDLIVQARDAGLVRPGQTVAVLAGAGSRSRSTDVLHLARVP